MVIKSPDLVTRSPDLLSKSPDFLFRSPALVVKSPEVLSKSSAFLTKSADFLPKSADLKGLPVILDTEQAPVIVAGAENIGVLAAQSQIVACFVGYCMLTDAGMFHFHTSDNGGVHWRTSRPRAPPCVHRKGACRKAGNPNV